MQNCVQLPAMIFEIRIRALLLLSLVLFILPGVKGQTQQRKAGSEEETLAAQKLALISALKDLDEQATNLPPLARALARAEIADAVWPLDTDWAKSLLMKAYELTFPADDERTQMRNNVAGSRPILPRPIDRARRNVRNRVMRVAGRDKLFADRLFQLGLDQLGMAESYASYTNLAESARQQDNIDVAGEYLLRAADLDPSQIAVGFTIADIAKTDRSRADDLIVQYFDRLKRFPLSRANASTVRVFLVVNRLIFPTDGTAPPGPSAMAAYVSFVIQSLGDMEAREPGSLAAYRSFLLRAQAPLRQYAPNLTADFMVLEQRSRSLDDSSSRTTSDQAQNMQQTNTESSDDQAIEVAVNEAIRRDDFDKAHKLIDKFASGTRKEQLADKTNGREALYFLKRDDLYGANRLAQKLVGAVTIREVYPELIKRCVTAKDETCATELMLQALKQLKRANTAPWTPPVGIPGTIVPTPGEFDPILDGLARLTLAITPISHEMALIGLGETVAAANVSQIDTSEGRVGFDLMVFKKLASKNESRVRQHAESLKDPLRRIVSLAAIYQWKASELTARKDINK